MRCKSTPAVLIFSVLLTCVLAADAQAAGDRDEQAALRQAAALAAVQSPATEATTSETTFKAGEIGLQALNPEISVTGDILFTYSDGDDVLQATDFTFRGLGIHLEAYLDPYSRFKAAFPINSAGTTLGEAYFTRYGALRGGNLTVGKFRQQFGVVNRWHKHGLDQVDFPLPLRMIFGAGGLNQTGVSLDWSSSAGTDQRELTVQITDAENGVIFSGNNRNKASVLAHFKNYHDVSEETYFELGVTALYGWNDTWTVGAAEVGDTNPVRVYGLDLTLAWEPLDQMRYRNYEWRTELYFVDKDILAPDGSGPDSVNPWGFFTYYQRKISRTADVGLRYDYYEPDFKPYADATLSPLAVATVEAKREQVVLYYTWFQSPFVKYRLELDHEYGDHMGADENRIILQCIFAAGPHKHERY